jgi:hypothetical protein
VAKARNQTQKVRLSLQEKNTYQEIELQYDDFVKLMSICLMLSKIHVPNQIINDGN